MELRQLRYFVMAAEALNFSQAARNLRIAQPALTRQIQQLEDSVGVKLFVRSPRGVSLTNEGRLLLVESRYLLAHVKEIYDRVRLSSYGEVGELNIGYAPSISSEILPPALSSFQNAAPNIVVNLQDLAGNELANGLRKGSLDLCVMQRPREEMGVDLDFEVIRTYSLCVAVSRSNPLARHKKISLEEIGRQKLIVFRQDLYSDYHSLLAQVFEMGVSYPTQVVECDGANSVFTEVEANSGVAILPQILHRLIGVRFKLVALDPEPPPLEVGICTSAKRVLTGAAQKFAAALRTLDPPHPKAAL